MLARLAGFRPLFEGRFLETQKPHLFLYLPVCFGLGIALYFGVGFEPSLMILASLAAVCVCAGLILMRFRYHLPFSVYLSISAVLIGGAGFSYAGFHTALNDTVMLTKPAGPLMIEGRVTAISLVKDDLRKVTLADVAMEGRAEYETPKKVRLRSYHIHDDVRLGQRVKVLARLQPPSRPVVPYAYDFQRRAYFQGLGAVGFTLGEVEVTQEAVDVALYQIWADIFEDMRHAINARIEGAQIPKIAGLSKALITGDRAAIRDEDYEALRSAGLAHLLAISGLHIGLVSGFVFVFLRFVLCLWPALALRYPIKKIAAFAAILSALFYMMLAGATIPTQRAALMSCIVFLAVILDRKAISLRLVAVSAMVVLLIAPESLLSPSFQLSFAAVTALIAFYEWWQRRTIYREVDLLFAEEGGGHQSARLFEEWRYSMWAKPFFYIGGIMMTSVIATFATSLFAIYHFGYVHAYGLLGNVLALPIVSLFVIPMAVAAMVLWPFPILSEAALRAMQSGINKVMDLAHGIHDFPFAVSYVPQISQPVFLMLTAAFILLCLLRGAIRFHMCLALVLVAVFIGLINQRQTIGFIHEDPIVISMQGHDGRGVDIFGAGDLSSFVRSQVQEFYGLQRSENFVRAGQSQCDAFGCMIEAKGKRVALVWDATQYHKMCGRENMRIIVSAVPIDYRDDCADGALITLDFFDLWRYGSYRIQYDGRRADLRVKSVEGLRGIRPWTTRGQREKLKSQRNMKKIDE